VAVLREEGAIPYCVARVRRFFARNPGRRRRVLGRTEREAFLSGIAARPGGSNWQIQQARDAVELYQERFRGIPLNPRPDEPPRPASRASAPSGPPSAVFAARGTVSLAGGYADGERSVKRQVGSRGTEV